MTFRRTSVRNGWPRMPMSGNRPWPAHARAPIKSQTALPGRPSMAHSHALWIQAGCRDEIGHDSHATRLCHERSPPASSLSCLAAASSRLGIDHALASKRRLRASMRAGMSRTQSPSLGLLVQAAEAIRVDVDMTRSGVLQQRQGTGNSRRERSHPSRHHDAMRQ